MRRWITFNTGSESYHLGIRYVHPNVLTGGDPDRIRKIASYLKETETTCRRGLVTVHGSYKGLPITAFSTGMGPSSVDITLPEVIEACDDSDMLIIRIGTAGGLQPHLNIGDFVVTTEVERAETTSDKIMGHGYRAVASSDVQNALVRAADGCKLPFQKVYVGHTKVTDEIYFDALASKAAANGQALAVSMEASVIFALRDRYNRDNGRKIRAGELLVISNNNVAEVAEPADAVESPRAKKLIEDAHIKAGLETLVAMREKG